MLRTIGLVMLVIGLLWVSGASAAEQTTSDIRIESARMSLVNDVYLLDADIAYHLSEQAVQALNNSVPLTFGLEVEIRKPRSYLWDERIARLRRDFRIEHHPLTDGFVIDDLITGIRQSFPSLDEALASLGHVVQMAVVDSRRLEPHSHYQALARTKLDIEALPAPLRLRAYFSSSWQLASDWFKWDLNT